MEKKILVQQWSSCRMDRCGRVYILTITGDGDHLLSPSSFDDMLAAATVVQQSPDAGALITTNEGRFFSNGLNLRWDLKNYSLFECLDTIRNKFEEFLCLLMKLGIPTICALCGHSIAAGFMIALAHDYRFMRNGRILYMAELDHALIMPRSLVSLVRSKLSPTSAREVLLKARKFTASEAFECGAVDGFFDDSAKTLEAAIAHAERLASSNWNRESCAILRARAFPGVAELLEAHADAYRWATGVEPY